MAEKCTDPCADLARVEQELTRLKIQNTESHKEIFHRLNTLEKNDAVQDTILQKLDELTVQVKALETRPAKRWEHLVGQIIGLVAAALVGLAVAKLGL